MTGKIIETFNINNNKFVIKWEEEKMSAFVLNRNYELQLPNNFTVVECCEMEYVDGGGTITFEIGANSFIIGALAAVGTSLTVAKATAVLAGLATTIAVAIELGTAGTGTLIAGAFLITFGGVIPTLAGFAVAYGVNSLKGKTFSANVPLVPSTTIYI